MTTIWQNDGTTWKLVTSSGFPDEAALHGLVEHAPHILPLAGGPRLVVVGREVSLGGNWADLIAVEPSGRLAIVEIKLAKNAEARRAVVAQVLTYAAFLHGMDPATLEQDVLGTHLRKRGFDRLIDAVVSDDQEGAFDVETFMQTLSSCLREGRFRLVLVLDDAPSELVRLVGYLGTVADKLTIDLVTVASYEIGGSQVVVPQLVGTEPEPVEPPALAGPPRGAEGILVEGGDAFSTTIEDAAPEHQQMLRRLAEWAAELERGSLAKLWTYHGKQRTTLLPHVLGEKAGLVTIWNDNGAALSFWRSVFTRRAPNTLDRIERSPDAPRIGQGTYTTSITEPLLSLLTQAYREAASHVSFEVPDET